MHFKTDAPYFCRSELVLQRKQAYYGNISIIDPLITLAQRSIREAAFGSLRNPFFLNEVEKYLYSGYLVLC